MKTRQHEKLRVPQGWNGQDKALVVQVDRVFDELFRLIGIQETGTVTAVNYDTVGKKLTVTVNGKTTDVVTVETIKSDLGAFTWGDIAGR